MYTFNLAFVAGKAQIEIDHFNCMVVIGDSGEQNYNLLPNTKCFNMCG